MSKNLCAAVGKLKLMWNRQIEWSSQCNKNIAIKILIDSKNFLDVFGWIQPKKKSGKKYCISGCIK